MDELEFDNFVLACKANKNVLVSSNILKELMPGHIDIFTVTQDLIELFKGLCGKVYDANIWLDASLNNNSIKISNSSSIKTSNDATSNIINDWSIPIELKNYKTIINLKPFW